MFVPLHVKSDYSLGYGTAGVEELVAIAAALGYRALALTDLENLCGQVRFHHECRRRSIRPLTGLELRPGTEGRRQVGSRAGRVLLLAADRTGYGSLCRLVSRRRGALGSPPAGIASQDLLPLVASHAEGLFALSDDPAIAERLLGSFPRERLGILLVRPGDRDADRRRQEAAERLGIQLVADLDAVFLRPADRDLHALQLAIRQGRQLAAVRGEDEIEGPDRWLRSPTEAAALFADRPETVTAAAAIAAACRLELPADAETDPVAGRHLVDASERLHALCAEAQSQRPPEAMWTAAHRSRLAAELAAFERLGFSGFMLVVAEILAHCRRQGIPVVVRGSAVSSLVLHLLGGSPVDPLAHGLLFERFLHAGKSAWPDVDLDLPWHRRDEVITWVYRHYGSERVAMVAAHHTFRQRSALREGLKAWGARPALIDAFSRALPPEDLTVEEIDFLGLADLLPDKETKALATLPAPGLAEILPLIERLVGRPRHLAAHPGGIVVGQGPLADLLPLERAAKGVVITQYDLVAVARLGLIKIDLLGNRCLSELEETLTLAGRPGPLRLETLPREDPATLALINRAETLGCFQLESPAMRALLSRIPIRSENDLIAALALIRPGPAAGEAKSAFIRRARGEEPPEPASPLLADRLAATHGLLLYEEDLMVLLSRAGKVSLEAADELRAAIIKNGGEPAALARLKAGFLQKAKAAGGEATLTRQAWEVAARFAAYSFNKAHAASYGRLAYLSAFTKAHHLLPFACALINHHQGLYPLRTLAAELARLGVVLRGPHVNHSDYPSRLEEGAVRVGLDKVKGLTRRAAAELLRKRTDRGPFASLRELLERVRLSRREITALVLAGVVDGLSPLAAADYPFAHEAALALLHEGGDPSGLDRLPIARPVAANSNRVHLYQALVRVRHELRILEMHLHAHPLALLREEAARHGCLPLREAAVRPAGARLQLVAFLAAMRRVSTRGGPMQFLTLEDETGLLEAAVPPSAYRRLGERVTTPGPFLVEGTLARQQDAVHLVVGQLRPFYQRERPFGR